MVDIEWNVNFIVRIVNNASFHNFRNRKKWKAKWFSRIKKRFRKAAIGNLKPMNIVLININMNLFIAKISIHTIAKCFTRWKWKGLVNHIGGLIDLENLGLIYIQKILLKILDHHGLTRNSIIY
jgi:hypothetical protein